MISMDRADLARIIDHTLLRPEAGPDEVEALCDEAAELHVGAVCVSPSQVPVVVARLVDGIAVATVVGFPSGAHRPAAKAAEAALAVAEGVAEIDMVIDLGLAMAGRWLEVEAEIAEVRAAVPSPLNLKVIIESALLESDAAIVSACRAAEAAGADYVKTSTGFHPAGGASAAAVTLMAATVDGRLGVKASGGIRDTATALTLVEAGATRLGCSATRAILDSPGLT